MHNGVTLKLHLENDRLFIEIEDTLWILATGAPRSFGNISVIQIEGEDFPIADNYIGLTIGDVCDDMGIKEHQGLPIDGLLGMDVLGCFDHVIDCAAQTITLSHAEQDSWGDVITLTQFMGIPVLTATIAGSEHAMVLETGANISYFQDDAIKDFPPAGLAQDFYPGYGSFPTDTHQVDMVLGDQAITLRCGTLPGVLAMMMAMAGTTGIVGNELLRQRKVGFFPRRGLLCIAEPE